MKNKNADLQSKSRELQTVLKASQEQLLSDTTIPLELINQLASVVRDMKNTHQVDLKNLLNKFQEAQEQFEKQQTLIIQQSKENSLESSSKLNSGSKENVSNENSVKIATSGTRGNENDAWKQELDDNKNMKPKKVVTILEEKNESVAEGPCTDSPASQSEVGMTELTF